MEFTPPKVLVIDDDVDLLMLLERKLAREGYWPESAASINEGREIIRNWKPDLILLDINVNGEDGRKLSWEIKSDPAFARTTIVLISGFDPSYRRAALFQADAVLAKPLDTTQLLHTLSYYLKPAIKKGA
jgi:CheY-like chemotaxis protein